MNQLPCLLMEYLKWFVYAKSMFRNGTWIYNEYELLFIHDCFVVDYVSDMFVDGETLHMVVEYMQIGDVHHIEIWINETCF